MIEKADGSKYVPGSCNIGKAEIRRRYRIGYIGLFIALSGALIIHITNASSLWKLLIFFPVFYSVSGFIQAISKFCFVYGFRNVISFTGIRRFERIKDEKLIRKDRRKAILIVSIVTIISLMIIAFYYVED